MLKQLREREKKLTVREATAALGTIVLIGGALFALWISSINDRSDSTFALLRRRRSDARPAAVRPCRSRAEQLSA